MTHQEIWEFLVAGEQEIAHTKPFFYPITSAATCTDSYLEVDQSAHCCDLLVESSSLGLDCCVQSAHLLLVKVVDLDPVCGPVFGQFTVLFASKFLGCAGGATCGSLWLSLWLLAFPCRHTLVDGCLASVMGVRLAVPPEEACCVPSSSAFRGLLGVVVLAWKLVPCFALWQPLWLRTLPLCCVEVELVAPLVRLCLEALIAAGPVALPTCGGRSGALCLRASKSQYGCCALEVVDVLPSTSAVVFVSRAVADVLSCLALPTSDVLLGFASVHAPVEPLV
ncbi:hypothetical protein Taro_017618 [Colocasia esculenta]|uniref:Uncharacterized protein n=1 Tax=Colocasia esculenta TaxID=4460 RepID=A0A843UZY1_COLES|nr:hypothetical protein [Colocasia esculenta]